MTNAKKEGGENNNFNKVMEKLIFQHFNFCGIACLKQSVYLAYTLWTPRVPGSHVIFTTVSRFRRSTVGACGFVATFSGKITTAAYDPVTHVLIGHRHDAYTVSTPFLHRYCTVPS